MIIIIRRESSAEPGMEETQGDHNTHNFPLKQPFLDCSLFSRRQHLSTSHRFSPLIKSSELQGHAQPSHYNYIRMRNIFIYFCFRPFSIPLTYHEIEPGFGYLPAGWKQSLRAPAAGCAVHPHIPSVAKQLNENQRPTTDPQKISIILYRIGIFTHFATNLAKNFSWSLFKKFGPQWHWRTP